MSLARVIAVAALLTLLNAIAGSSPVGATNFTASQYPTAATAESNKGNDDFKTEAGSVECKSHYGTTITGPSEVGGVAASFTECSAFGFLSATVNMNGCIGRVHTNGEADLECSGTNKIVVTASTCEITVGTQTGLKKVELSNGAGDIIARANISGIAYTVTKDGFGCPFSGTGAKTGATFTQNNAVTVQATNGATIDIG